MGAQVKSMVLGGVSSALISAPTRFQVIGVQAYGGSGSLFMQSLLDGHPDILSLPGTLGIQYYVTWGREIHNLPDADINYDRIKAFILAFFAIAYDTEPGEALGLNELGEDMKERAAVRREDFEAAFEFLVDRLINEEGLEPKERLSASNVNAYRTVCLKAVYLAFAFCNGEDLSRKKFLLYPAHGGPMNDIGGLCQDFEAVKFIHMVREPIQNLDSVQRRLNEEVKTTRPDVDSFWCVINHIYFDRAPQAPVCGVPMYSLHPYPTSSTQNSLAVRLEDLHRSSREAMSELAKWLGLQWSETLMTSTFAGKKWWNLPGLRRVSGFNPAMVGRDPEFGLFDQWRLRQLGAPIGVHFRYPGYRRDPLAEAAALLLSLLPFELEVKTFSFRHLMHTVNRRMPWNDSPGSEIWNKPKQYGFTWTACALTVLATPIFAVWYYVKHRAAIWNGFHYNRDAHKLFVPLLEIKVQSQGSATGRSL